VYNMGLQDYMNSLCTSNYSAQDSKIFTHSETVSCSPEGLKELGLRI
jgi:hypothetical protein